MPVEDPIRISVPAATISKRILTIAGISCTIYGLDELPSNASSVSCLWLLHPRLGTQERMEPVAQHTIIAWNERYAAQSCTSAQSTKGLIAVSFDQRNHNSRLIDPICNEAWRHGNPRHAQDMFSIFQGTALDTSQLITYLPGYVFPSDENTISEHMVLGISLGGHSAWHCILHDPRITTAVVVIGCADYARVMTDRARLSKLETYTKTSPPGSKFLGSTDFPKSLCEAVAKWDPTGLFVGQLRNTQYSEHFREPTELERVKLVPMIKSHLQGKRIMNLAGGSDKLVPYNASKPFLDWLKFGLSTDGWLSSCNVRLEDFVFDFVGHTMSEQMLKEAIRFILEAGPCKHQNETPRI